MKVRDLIERLQAMPQDAEAVIRIWHSNGPSYHWFNQYLGEPMIKKLDGKEDGAAVIAMFDNCPMYRLEEENGELTHS